MSEYQLSLKVGIDKMYKIQNITRFFEDVRLNRYASYGKKLGFHHGVNNYDSPHDKVLKYLIGGSRESEYAKKAIELSRKSKKLPHMHVDVKEEGGGRKRNTKRQSEDRPREEKRDGRKSSRSERSSRKADVKKSNRPNVHSQTERSSSRKSGNNASAFVKGKKKAERF